MLVEIIKDDINRFKADVQNGNPYKPLFVKIKLVWDCNLRCQMCNHWRSKSSPLDLDFFLGVIDELAELGCKRIHITGGEPLMYPEIHKLIKRIKNHGIKATMTTNGTLVTIDNAELLVKSGLKKVNISIDSPNPEVHDYIRGIKGSHRRTVRGFGFLRNLMPQRSININMVVSPSNYKTVSDLPKFAKEIKASSINLMPLNVHTSDVSFFTQEQISEYNNEIAPIVFSEALKYGIVKDEKDIFIFGNSKNSIENAIIGNYSDNYYSNHKCYALWTHALIDHQGRVTVCCRMPQKPIIGNLQTNSFKEIWHGETYSQLRKSENLPISNVCKKCSMFKQKNQQIDNLLSIC